MRAPLSWIRDFTPIEAEPDVVATRSTISGSRSRRSSRPVPRSVASSSRIVEVLPHPNADKLQLADVDTGDGVVRVVCGAPNIHAGMVVPLATVGGHLPGGIEIARRKIRGEVSEGMLCSTRELGLGEDHAGILAIDGKAELGTDVREVLGLDDVVFHLSLTPNRPDAMGIVGVARELAAHFGLHLTIPEGGTAARWSTRSTTRPSSSRRPTAAHDSRSVWRRSRWGVARMDAASTAPGRDAADQQRRRRHQLRDARTVPAVARVRSRPARRSGLVVRLAKPGEKMTTLDDVERTLHPDDLLICDAERAPQAIAGIMGGRDSEVDARTREILLESAYFEPSGIAASAKRLGLRSEASARFERGIDPNGAASGAARSSCSRRSRAPRWSTA